MDTLSGSSDTPTGRLLKTEESWKNTKAVDNSQESNTQKKIILQRQKSHYSTSKKFQTYSARGGGGRGGGRGDSEKTDVKH